MTTDVSNKTNHQISNYDDLLQSLANGVPPNQLNDEINLGELFSRLAEQWKLFLGALVGGTLLATVLALVLPVVYQPSLTVSVPLAGNVAALTATDTLLGEEANLPSSPQDVFTSYYNLLRSGSVMAEYIQQSNYLEKLYPDSTEPESVMIANLMESFKVKIKEPTPERKGGYIADPKRVLVGIDINDEAIGVEMLNSFASYANQRLITDLRHDADEIIKNNIDMLTKQIARQREESKQNRFLTIKKMEKENEEEIALLQEQISAHLAKAKANRLTQIAHAKEALEMARSLNIEYPTTLDAIAQKGQKGKSMNTAITVIDKPTSSLYLQGTKYLTTLINTLTNRKSDEEYLLEINNLREMIHVIENDQVLAALKKRKSDDPWIKGLPENLAKIDALKNLNPDFSSVVAFTMDEPAAVTNERVKPKRMLIVVAGFALSFFIAVFIALIAASIKEKQQN